MKYYVNRNAQPDSKDHEVHEETCDYYKKGTNMEYLGDFTNCHDAVAEAKRKGYSTADGCAYCSSPCHTG